MLQKIADQEFWPAFLALGRHEHMHIIEDLPAKKIRKNVIVTALLHELYAQEFAEQRNPVWVINNSFACCDIVTRVRWLCAVLNHNNNSKKSEMSIIDLQKRQVIKQYSFNGFIRSMKLSPVGDVFFIPERRCVYSLESGEILGTFSCDFSDVCFSPNGKFIIARKKMDMTTKEEDDLIYFFDTYTIELKYHISVNPCSMTNLNISDDGKFIVFKTKPNTQTDCIEIWNIQEQKKYSEIVEKAGCMPLLSPDGNYLASGLKGGIVTVWNFRSTRPNILQTDDGSSVDNAQVSFSPDSKLLASSYEYSPNTQGSQKSQVKIWDFRKNGGVLKKNYTYNYDIKGLGFSPDGEQLVVKTSQAGWCLFV